MSKVYRTRTQRQQRRGAMILFLVLALAVLGIVGAAVQAALCSTDVQPDTTPAPAPVGAAVTVTPLESENRYLAHLRVRLPWLDGWETAAVASGYSACESMRNGTEYAEVVSAAMSSMDMDSRSTAVIIVDAAQSTLCSDVDF